MIDKISLSHNEQNNRFCKLLAQKKKKTQDTRQFISLRAACEYDLKVAQNLFGSKQAIARVAQTGYDIAVLVELFVDMCHEDIYVRMRFMHGGDAFGGCNQAHKTNA